MRLCADGWKEDCGLRIAEELTLGPEQDPLASCNWTGFCFSYRSLLEKPTKIHIQLKYTEIIFGPILQ